MQSRNVYHITDEKNVLDILSKGIISQKGPNSILCDEPEKCIYLCDAESIPYWTILLGYKNPKILEIELSNELNNRIKEYKYTGYKEFVAVGIIYPSAIRLIEDLSDFYQSHFSNDLNTELNNAMRKLCEEYILDISSLCVSLIKIEERGNYLDMPFDEMLVTPKILLEVIKRLDWSCKTQAEYRQIIYDYGNDGGFTFVDTYRSSSERLYKVISSFEYKKVHPLIAEKLKQTSQFLTNFIENTFSDCLDLNVGGYL